jgi:Spy/CpxP family protein refolding chaperone
MKRNRGLFSMGVPIVVVLVIVGLGLPCFSQPPREGRPGGPDSPAFRGDEPPPPLEKREKIRKRIELIRMWKLTEELDLTEETGAKLFPILRKYDEKRIALQKERQNIMDQLRKALEDEATSDEAIEATMDTLDNNASAMSDLLRQQREELKGILSPRQQAKFIIFQREFHREIRKIIGEARERRRRAKWEEGKGRNRRYDRPRRD